ncbi:MAG: hypothetical protein JWN70_4265 [Planctomycetaceae bacterium]|nr:hypothetical protein [Planctomycetaceae bacterium]
MGLERQQSYLTLAPKLPNSNCCGRYQAAWEFAGDMMIWGGGPSFQQPNDCTWDLVIGNREGTSKRFNPTLCRGRA